MQTVFFFERYKLHSHWREKAQATSFMQYLACFISNFIEVYTQIVLANLIILLNTYLASEGLNGGLYTTRRFGREVFHSFLLVCFLAAQIFDFANTFFIQT